MVDCFNSTGSDILTSSISCGIGQAFGTDATFLGFLLIGIFALWLVIGNTRIDHKAAIFIPVCLLAGAFISWIVLIMALIVGAILALLVLKFFNR